MDYINDWRLLINIYEKYIKAYKGKYLIIISLLSLSLCISLIEPILNIKLIDEVLPDHNITLLIQLIVIYLVVCAVNILISYIVQKVTITIDNSLIIKLKKVTIQNMLEKHRMNQSNDQRSNSIIKITDDIKTIVSFFDNTVIGAITNLGNILMLSVYLFRYSILLTVLIFLNCFIQIYIVSKYVKPLQNVLTEGKNNSKDEMGYLNSTFRNLILLKCYNHEKNNLKQYDSILKNYQGISLKNFFITFTQSSWLSVTTVLGLIVTLLAGSFLIFQGNMTIGILVAFLNLSDKMKYSLSYIISLNKTSQMTLVSAKRIYENLEISEQNKETGKEDTSMEDSGWTSFNEDVTRKEDSRKENFKKEDSRTENSRTENSRIENSSKEDFKKEVYSEVESSCMVQNINNTGLEKIYSIKFLNLNYSIGEKILFQNVSFDFVNGHIYILCGENGVGKSTLINILLKLCEVDNNTVFYNEDDINSINPKDIRDKVSVALQTNYFLNATIKDNILMGRAEDEIKLDQVLEIVGLKDTVNELEDGIHTELDDSNSQLSGGELQRIALARALLKEADVYLFDEIFSNIDSISTLKMFHSICSYLHNKIVLFITHDKEILNLNNDNIIEIKNETFLSNSRVIKIS